MATVAEKKNRVMMDLNTRVIGFSCFFLWVDLEMKRKREGMPKNE